MASRRPQHSKGKKRPGHWHQGRSLAREQVPALKALAAAEERGVKIDAKLAVAKSEGAKDTEAWFALNAAAPFVPKLHIEL